MRIEFNIKSGIVQWKTFCLSVGERSMHVCACVPACVSSHRADTCCDTLFPAWVTKLCSSFTVCSFIQPTSSWISGNHSNSLRNRHRKHIQYISHNKHVVYHLISQFHCPVNKTKIMWPTSGHKHFAHTCKDKMSLLKWTVHLPFYPFLFFIKQRNSNSTYL